MLISLEWLKDYVNLDGITPEKFEEEMVLTGTNSEGLKNMAEHIENIAVCQLMKIGKHPEADRLSICMAKLDPNSEEYTQVLTAATNVKEGDFVPLAKHNSRLADGTKIKKNKMRGEISNGMFCSYQELGFEESVVPKSAQTGLLVLGDEFSHGQDIIDALKLDDGIVDFEITPNRPDCLSVLGIAREAAATFDREFHKPDTSIADTHGDIHEYVKIEVQEGELCHRYTGRVITDVVVKPSPMWLQIRLMKLGIRPINNIVDITNYVLLEYGQPIHAFDLDKLKGNKIIVRRANDGEKVVTLDEVERKLDGDMLLICDEESPVAIAGIMGAGNSGVSEETKNLLIEVATFDKASIRESSKKLGLRSESSSRFEKGVPAEIADEASKRVCHLIEKLGAGKIVEGVIDIYPQHREIPVIDVRIAKINSLLGLDLNIDEIKKALIRLECEVAEFDGSILKVQTPYHRLDLLEEIDIVEEVARIYGYNNLESSLPQNEVVGMRNEYQNFSEKTFELLVAQGLYEFKTYSFTGMKELNKLGVEIPEGERLCISNPLSEEYGVMRNTLIANVLNSVSYNLKRNNERILGFELGNTFKKVEGEPVETMKLCLAICHSGADFFEIKGVLENLFENLHIAARRYVATMENPIFHIGRCADIVVDEKVIATVGEISPDVLSNFEIKKRVYVAEINFDALFAHRNLDCKYIPLPKYPASSRDMAVVVDEEITNQELLDKILEFGGKYLEEARLFDIYRGDQVEEGKKSMAYSLSFRSLDKTLVDTDVNESFDHILKALQESFDARLR